MTAFEWKSFFVWRVTYICVHVTQAQFLPTSSKHVSPGMRFLGLGIGGLSHQSCMSLHIGTNNIVGGSMMHIRGGGDILTHMYQLCGTILGSVNSKKYLEVYLNHNLKWDYHIGQVTAKAARKLGFIHCNLRGAPAECKKLAYITLVLLGMGYASIIWDPHTNTNSDKLEKNPTFSC